MTPITDRHLLAADALTRCRLALLHEAQAQGLDVGEDLAAGARKPYATFSGMPCAWGEMQRFVDEAKEGRG